MLVFNVKKEESDNFSAEVFLRVISLNISYKLFPRSLLASVFTNLKFSRGVNIFTGKSSSTT